MPLSMLDRVGQAVVKPTRMTLQLVDRSINYPYGVIENMLVKVDKFIFLADLVVMNMKEDSAIPIILGRPFMKTARAIIDVENGEFQLRVHDEVITFNVFETMTHPNDKGACFRMDVLDEVVLKATQQLKKSSSLECVLTDTMDELDEEDVIEMSECLKHLNTFKEISPSDANHEELKGDSTLVSTKPELKILPIHLKYVFLEPNGEKPIIISNSLSQLEEEKLIKVLQVHKEAIGWSISDLKCISQSYCMHKINMESDYKPIAQPQRRLNPIMKEEVRKEVLKLLEAGMIYPISNSEWVSPVQVVPKKGGMTVITNEKNELIPTRTVTSWRMCIDYRKLNQATRKDHFPLPFKDQMLERLAGQAYYYFLDGYSGYNQIAVNPEDQEKTSFTCPFGVFAYRRMPFGLCNAPATFQRCMLAIFAHLVEKCIEVFMDDFSVFGSSYDVCLENLELVLKRCIDTNLVLNWEKCHFMVQEGIVLGHKISARGIEVDKAKVDVIEKLPPPMNVKGVRSFLGHAGFYRRFIKDFYKIAKPLCTLLNKDQPFLFDEECMKAFLTLKNKLTTAPVIVAPDWSDDFELCVMPVTMLLELSWVSGGIRCFTLFIMLGKC
uniref:Retrovirus-related Pol polyprotein from transposon 17.6 n=1 Tax=Cajanus cajan TaxID=3821 RepID=A0A151S3L5_CAJCA|nr:Retrovirus-related Pol polyprotein from transposon 17.6 [Cajanus cajan]